MKLVPLSNLFEIEYGNSLELNKLEITISAVEGVNFISRTAKNNGVSAIVKQIPGEVPYVAGLITVALGGSVLETFLQPKPFYTSYHVMVLTPKQVMTEKEKLFYCLCIAKNKYRYNYGRQANKTLRNLKVPANPPQWAESLNVYTGKDFSLPVLVNNTKLKTSTWKWFSYSDLFEIERGRGARLSEISETGATVIVTSTDQNNGWSGKTNNNPIHKANVISVTRNGSVGEAFYQPQEFCSTEDVHIFNPNFKLNPYIALFLVTVIRKEKYRYNYGRKWGLQRMRETKIKLPIDRMGEPDWTYMENYIKSLPFSSAI